MLNRIFLIAMLAALLGGCATERESNPAPESSSYFVTRGAGFRVQVDAAQNLTSVRYEIVLGLTAQHAGPLYLRTLFENPLDTRRPFVVDTVVEPGTRQVELESPDITGLESGKTYKIMTGVFGAPARQRELGFHVQPVRFVKPGSKR